MVLQEIFAHILCSHIYNPHFTVKWPNINLSPHVYFDLFYLKAENFSKCFFIFILNINRRRRNKDLPIHWFTPQIAKTGRAEL